MKTLEQRITTLEQINTSNSDFPNRTYQELLDAIGYPDGISTEKLQELLKDARAKLSNQSK